MMASGTWLLSGILLKRILSNGVLMAKAAGKSWFTILFSLPFIGIGIGFLALSIIPTLF
jgi:hypothetical protein